MNDLNAEAPRVDRRGRFKAIVQSLIVGLAATLLLVAFVSIGGEVVEGETRGFDGYILRQAQLWRFGHPWFVSAMRDLSSLGSTVVLSDTSCWFRRGPRPCSLPRRRLCLGAGQRVQHPSVGPSLSGQGPRRMFVHR